MTRRKRERGLPAKAPRSPAIEVTTINHDQYSANTARTEAENRITVTFFADRAAKTKDQRDLTVDELVDLIATTTASSKERLPWLKLAVFGDEPSEEGNSLRHDGNVRFITGIEADYDGEKVGVDEVVSAIERSNIAAIVYTSPSYRPDAPRWRVLCPFVQPLVVMCGVHGRMLGWLNGALGGVIGGESWTLSQAYYYGSVRSNPNHRVEVVRGRPLEYCGELAETAIEKPGYRGGGTRVGGRGNGKGRSAEYWRAVLAGVPQHGIPELGIAGRDKAAASLAGRLLLEVDRDALMPLMREWNERNKPPLKGSDLRRIVNSIGSRAGR
jgi:hypothetical protein